MESMKEMRGIERGGSCMLYIELLPVTTVFNSNYTYSTALNVFSYLKLTGFLMCMNV
jgi:hypothetical protein